jgi:hypothetical protein
VGGGRKKKKRYTEWDERNKIVFIHKSHGSLCRKSEITDKKNFLELVSNYSREEDRRLTHKSQSLPY